LDFGAVLNAPHAGVIGLTEWALELWHYINGLCLLQGLNLKEMEASDMLDVLHYLFEQDTIVNSQEEYESKNSVRRVIYQSVYNRDFAYLRDVDTNKSNVSDDYEPFDEFDNYTPTTSNSVKPYTPPTNFDPDAPNPFGSALREAPLG